MKGRRTVVVGIVALVALAALGRFFSGAALTVRADFWTHVASLLGVLAAVSIFLERSIEVFLSAFRAADADILDQRIKAAQDEYDLLKSTGDSAELAAAKSKLDEALAERTKYRNRSRVYALWGGLLGGTLVSCAGFRTLGAMVTNAPTSEWRGSLFVAIDVLLSGALIAGGSDAMNKVMKLYNAVMETAGQKAKGTQPAPSPQPQPLAPAAQAQAPAAGAPAAAAGAPIQVPQSMQPQRGARTPTPGRQTPVT